MIDGIDVVRVQIECAKAVQAWEQGLRTPSDAALRLLIVAERHPEAIVDAY